MDFARSTDPGVQTQLDRLAALGPGADSLGLDRIRALLARLGNPEAALPPVFHVAGTNGKGSTCAFLRTGLEAAGHRVHVYTSPHLVRFNERIRLAGRLIDDDALASLLAEVLDAGAGLTISFFEATTAAAFLAFARTPADACVIEVGLGGRLDATNVIPRSLVGGIAQLGLDHQQFLGDTIAQVAAEKAGIARAGVPLLTQSCEGAAAASVARIAAETGAQWLPRGSGWDVAVDADRLHYRDTRADLTLPLPRLPGAHQTLNAGLAIAMLRHQDALAIPDPAFTAMLSRTEWPARLQRLGPGRLTALLPHGAQLWLDGAHNPAAARGVADWLKQGSGANPLHLIMGVLANKDLPGILGPFAGSGAAIHAVPVPGHAHHAPEVIAAHAQALGLPASPAADVETALRAIARAGAPGAPPFVLIIGSLYLAGAVLAANGEPPA